MEESSYNCQLDVMGQNWIGLDGQMNIGIQEESRTLKVAHSLSKSRMFYYVRALYKNSLEDCKILSHVPYSSKVFQNLSHHSKLFQTSSKSFTQVQSSQEPSRIFNTLIVQKISTCLKEVPLPLIRLRGAYLCP